MKPLDVWILVWTMRRDHVAFDYHTQQKAHQCGREITPGRAAHKAGIIIEGEHGRQTLRAEKLGHDFQQGFGIEVRPDLLMQPDRGTSIHKVGDLHHMLSLAIWISGHTTRIFEIELDFLPWMPQFQLLPLAAMVLGHTARPSPDLPDR